VHSVPASHTYHYGGTQHICVKKYYYLDTKYCEECIDICFPELKPSNQTTGVSQTGELLAEVKVYPNPANNFTKVEFNLKEDQQLKVQLIDISGRVVKTVKDEKASKGYHFVEINTSDVSSGMYIIRMETGQAIANYRLSVIK
jgi:hypothetical protein